MSKILKDSEASIASPQILYYLKSASGAAKSPPRRPGDLLGDPPQILGSPGNQKHVVAPLGPKIF